ncbi:phage portal protein [uncultured Paraglaciecola sp.]|uniref:phage portal protein n=1 Tax=uncultured Paraglaciecola sp. TaxID=1765024 RepID=UPI00261BBE80|nr:phage portal protein [uncultured Paraglaciecola sp.]
MRLFPWRVKSGSIQSATTPDQIEELIRASLVASANGIDVTHAGALAVPEVLGCVNVLSQSMSMLPLNVYKRTGKRREVNKKSAVYRVLSQKPNSFQSPLEFKRSMTFNCAWQGNAYAHITWLGNKPLQLTPIPTASCKPKQNEDYSITYRVTPDLRQKYKYIDYDERDIFHLRGPICPRGWMSDSPISMGKDAIAMLMAIDKFGGGLFRGGNQARGAFRLPQMESLSKEEFDRLKDTLNDAVESGKTPLLEQGLEYVKMDYSARDSQWADVSDAAIAKICRIWRIQPHMIQSLKDATFSNIEHQSREFVDHTLMPWIQLWESAIKMQLMDPADESQYPKISAQALLRGDNETRAKVYQMAVGGPYMKPGEARELEDMDRVDGDDVLLRPLNLGDANAPQETIPDDTKTTNSV